MLMILMAYVSPDRTAAGIRIKGGSTLLRSSAAALSLAARHQASGARWRVRTHDNTSRGIAVNAPAEGGEAARSGLPVQASAPASALQQDAEQQGQRPSKTTVAAIDCGTNSFHLVVVRTSSSDQRRLEVIDQMKEGVRLLDGGGRFNLITSDGVAEGIRVLKRFQQVAATRKASLRAVATSAVREARNGQTFVRQVKERLGLDIEVISGFEEARLIYLGVLQALPIYDKLALTVDIGGGSTEIALGVDGQPLYIASMRLGHLRLQERSFPGLTDGGGEFTLEQVEDCRRFVRAALADAGVVQEIQQNSPPGRTFEVAVGSSGTIEAVAQLALGLAADDKAAADSGADDGGGLRDMHFSASQLRAVMKALLRARTREQRLKLPGMQAKRVDVVVPGAVLLDELFGALGVEDMRVSPFALREGVLQDSLMRQLPDMAPTLDIRRASILHLASRFDIEQRMASALHSAQLARQMLRGLQAGSHASVTAALLTSDDAFLLEAGVTLHSVGLFVSHAANQKHAYYIVRNSEHLLGFAPAEVEMIALLVRFHRCTGAEIDPIPSKMFAPILARRKKTPSAKHEEVARLSPDLFEKLRALVAIARMAIALERRNTGGSVAQVSVLQDNASVVLVVTPGEGGENGAAADISLELWALQQELPYFEKVFGVSCMVVEGTPGMESAELLSSLDTVVSS